MRGLTAADQHDRNAWSRPNRLSTIRAWEIEHVYSESKSKRGTTGTHTVGGLQSTKVKLCS